jgi:hypothetical protein
MKTMTWMAATTLFLALGGCAHRGSPGTLEPAARAAVDQSRGLCVTDLNQTEMLLNERPDGYGLIFKTEDASQAKQLHERTIQLGQALSVPHPAVNARGEKVQHAGVPTPELVEVPEGTGYAVELIVRAPDGDRKALKAHLDDHVRLGQQGECPVMTDESVRPSETQQWSKVDR